MGHFYYSYVGDVSTEDVESCIAEIVGGLFNKRYSVRRSNGLPVTEQDNRVCRWEFWLPDWDVDCAFTMSLLNDGRMEFKVPRSQWDQYWEDQQSIRRRLVRRLKKVS